MLIDRFAGDLPARSLRVGRETPPASRPRAIESTAPTSGLEPAISRSTC